MAKFARDSVGVDDFLEIDNTVKYGEWLEYHFFYGLGNISYRADSVTNGTIVMVGPPRVRQVSVQCARQTMAAPVLRPDPANLEPAAAPPPPFRSGPVPDAKRALSAPTTRPCQSGVLLLLLLLPPPPPPLSPPWGSSSIWRLNAPTCRWRPKCRRWPNRTA